MCEWRTKARSPALSRRLTGPAGSCRAADGDEVQGALQAVGREAKVRGGDRRREAIVERPGQLQALVHRVPAELDRDLVGAQLASVKEAVELDDVEVVLAERPELLRAVLLEVPWVVRLLGSV